MLSTVSRTFFSAGAGWYGAMVVALGAGWVSPGSEPPSAEELWNHFDEIDHTTPHIFVHSVDEETDEVLARLEAGSGAA